MPTNSVQTRFTMDGVQDAAQQLAAFGAAANGAIAKVGTAVNAISQAFGALESGVGKIAKIIAVVGGAGGALLEFAKHSSEATNEVGHLATQSGNTIESMSGLLGSLSTMGANTENLGTAFKRLSVQIETVWPEIQKSVKDAADGIINNQNKIVQSTLGVESAQLSLFNVRQKLANLRGVATDPAVTQAQELKAAQLAVAEGEAKLADAIQKRAEAVKKADEDQKNSIASVSAAVAEVTAGVSSFAQASSKATLNLDNIIKGLVVNAGPAAAQLDGFKGSLQDLGNQAPNVQAVFLKLSAFMHNSGDDALNTAVAFKLFGRGVEQNLIEALKQGPAAIQKNIDKLKQLGVVLTESDKHAAEDFRKSFNALLFDISTTSTKIGNLFSPAFSEGFQNLSTVIEQGHATILKWADDIASRVKPIILDFFNILTGQKIETPWLESIVNNVKNAVDGFSRLAPVAKAALLGITIALGAVAQAINLTFGTNLDAASIAMVLFAVRILPVWASVAVAIGSVVAFLDKLSGSSDSLGVSIDATSKRWAVFKDLLDSKISVKEFFDIERKIGEEANKANLAIAAGTQKTGSIINDVFDKVRADTTANFKKLADDVAGSFDKVPGAAGHAADGIKAVGDSAKSTTTAVELLGDGLRALNSIKVVNAADAFKPAATSGIKVIENKFKLTDADLAPLDKNVDQVFADSKEKVDALGKSIKAVGDDSNTLWEEINARWQASPFDPVKRLNELKTLQVDGFKALSELWDNVKEKWNQSPINIANLSSSAGSLGADLLAAASKAWDDIKTKWSISPVDAQALNVDATIGQAFENLVTKAQSAWDRIAAIFSQQLPAPSGGGFGGNPLGAPFARGTDHPLLGPGTWTSDSILARVSRGEAVLQAASVHALIKHFGAGILGVLNNFHRLGSQLKFKFPKFNAGALISTSLSNFKIPQFNAGALINSVAIRGGLRLSQFNFEGLLDALRMPALQTLRFAGALNNLQLPKFAAGGMIERLAMRDGLHLPKLNLRGLVDYIARMQAPKFNLGAMLDVIPRLRDLRLRKFAAGGIVDYESRLKIPKLNLGGLVDYVARLQTPKLNLGGFADYIARLQVPKFNLGGLVGNLSLPELPRLLFDGALKDLRLPKFAFGGLVDNLMLREGLRLPKALSFDAIIKNLQLPKFNIGGLAQNVSHSFDVIPNVFAALRNLHIPRFSVSGALDGLKLPALQTLRFAGALNNLRLPKFSAGGFVDIVQRLGALRIPQFNLQQFKTGGFIDNLVLRGGLQLPRFDIGGLVDSLSQSFELLIPPIPSFAQGGLALAPARGGVSGRPVILQFSDGNSVHAVTSDGGIKEIERQATLRKVRSSGRRQSSV